MADLSLETINKLRSGSSTVYFIYLIEAYDENGVFIFRINNSDKDVTSKGITYTSFPFGITQPTLDGSSSSNVSLVIPNFSSPHFDRELFKKIVSIDLKMIDSEDTSPDKSNYLIDFRALKLNRIEITQTIITISFQQHFLDDKKFPFRRFSKQTHPTLYTEE